MRKLLATVLLILAFAVLVDQTYGVYQERVAEGFNPQLSATLVRVRPFVLIITYSLIGTLSYRFFTYELSNQWFSVALILIGLLAAYIVSFPPSHVLLSSDELYNVFVRLSSSSLGLTIHTSSLLAAFGFIRLLWKFFYSKA